jgi:GT2 family glycosyltransferase/SAM-dependent methyltransferase
MPADPYPALLVSEPPRLAGADFDVMQRYSLAARLLDRMIGQAPRPARILEVGCNTLDVLGQFLVRDQVRTTRCDVEPFADDPDFVLIERGKPLPFADDSFDAVVSLEVLEHMPRDARPAFLAECLRVARRGAIIACPNGRPEVIEAERRVVEAYRYRRGVSNPFLAEHQQFGLPTEEEVRGALRDLGVRCACFNSMPLDCWVPLAVLTQTVGERSPLAYHLFQRINRFFFPGLATLTEQCYRKFYVCAKHADAVAALEPLPELVSLAGHNDPQPLSTQDLLTVARVVSEVVTPIEREAQQLHSCRAGLHVCRERLARWERWTAPLCRVTSLFRPRRYLQADLLPSPQLETAPGGRPGGWVSTGRDALFRVNAGLPAGWVRLRLKIRSELGGLVRFGIEDDRGVHLVDQFPLARGDGLVIDRYYKFTDPVPVIRIEPPSGVGQVTIDDFCFEAVPLPRLFARAVGQKLANLWREGRLLSALGNGLKRLVTGDWGNLKSRLRRTLPQPPQTMLDDAGTAGQPTTEVPDHYAEWRQRHQLTVAERERLLTMYRQGKKGPRLSVLLPVEASVEAPLRQAVESVRAQLYPHWELCIALNPAGPTAVRSLLEEYAGNDPRIKLVTLAHAATGADLCNAALEMATGEYTGLLHANGELAEHALHCVAQALSGDPAADFLYSDEDQIDTAGRHVEPFFKPGWSPEYLLAGMYTGNLGVYRTALARAVGGFRAGYEPAHVYDLALRLTARTSHIVHISYILYHAHGLAASGTPEAVASALARRAVDSHLAASGENGRAEPGPLPGWHRVRFAVNGRPKVSIIIPTACKRTGPDGDSPPFLLACLDSIRRRTTYDNYEILVVVHDLDLPPRLALELARRGVRRVSDPGPFNFAAKINLGASRATGSHLLLLNDDTTILTPDWVEALLEFSQRAQVGVVGAKLLYPDGRLQHGGVTLLNGWPRHHFPQFPGDHPGYHGNLVLHRNVSAVTGACFMTRAEVFRSLAGFAEEFAVNYNDIDYCLRVLESGLRVVYQPFAQLYHYESASRQLGVLPDEHRLFEQRWARKWPRDPYYNVNLSTSHTDFRIGVEPTEGSDVGRAAARAA